jgi:hypothetical protein
MRAAATLAWRLLRAGGRRDLVTAALAVGAFAVTTALLLLVLAGNVGFAARADHKAWREPVAAGADAAAVELVGTHLLRDHPVTVVELAALRPDAPVPPGLSRFPAPGELWVSPALGRLLSGVPAGEFADRFGGRGAGVLDRDALAYPDELVAVVGHRPEDRRLTAPAAPGVRGDTAAPTRIASFTGRTDTTDAELYSTLTRIATALLLVPLLILGAAAARLGVSRRLARLAAMRLVGATPRQVVTLTAVESMVAAAAGALLGGLLYLAVLPLVARIGLAGGQWFTADLLLPPVPAVAALGGIVLLGAASAVVGLRGVVVSPLGVAQRHTPRRMRAIRLVAFAVLLGAFSVVTGDKNAGIGAIVTVLGLLFGGVALLGPWVVGLIGRLVVGLGRGPATLLAGRRLVDDPRAAWRTVGGLTLAGFVAGFIALIPDLDMSSAAMPADQLAVTVQQGTGTDAAARIDRELRAAGVAGRVAVSPREGAAPPGPDQLTVTAPADRGLDRARTAVARAVLGAGVEGAADLLADGRRFLDDIRTGTVLVLGATFLVAMASAGITSAAAVLDRRRTYGQLRLAGTPLAVLDRARALETLLPLIVLGLGSIGLGVFSASPIIASARGLTSAGLLGLGVCVAVGLAGIVAASAASRPLLAAVTRDPAPQPA